MSNTSKTGAAEVAKIMAESLWAQLDGDPFDDDGVGGWLQYATKAVEEIEAMGYGFTKDGGDQGD